MGEAPKILLVADYSNFHSTLARGLRKIGCDVTLVSDGGTYMQTERDIDITRRHHSKAGGLLYSLQLYPTLRRLRNFDIVSFRDPAFLELKPERIRFFFNLLAQGNPNLFLSYLTTDVKFLDMLEAPDSPLRYSEWFVDGEPNRLRLRDEAQWRGWHAPEMQRLATLFYSKMKGAVTALYEYHKAAERLFPADRIAYGGIPVDVDAIPFRLTERPRRVRIFLARDRRRQLQKGSDLLEAAAREVASRHPDKAEFVMLENVTRQEYMDTMQSCHLMLDQMYSYTPATMALEGMATGLTVISGAEPEYYDFIGERENFPIVNSPIDYDSLLQVMETIILHPESFAERGLRGREFVAKHNAMETVARRFLNFWLSHVQS